MRLTIHTPAGQLLQTETDNVSFPGEMGNFTVLHNHAPIISNLLSGDIVYAEAGEKKRISIKNGFVRVLKNNIEVCAEV